jgi:peptidoglycan hydrolase-like protein with peptidoglycan-binding domain
MTIFSTVAFGDYDPVTGPPTIDGWTGNEDPGVVTDFAEPGYATGGRLTYGGGAKVPPVVFQCVHMTVPFTSPPGVQDAGEYLVFSFFCTFDYSFDDADGVTIALIPDMTKSGDLTTYRRIDVLPNTNAVGAGSGGPAENTPPGVFFGADYGIRYQRAIPNLTIWKGTGLSDTTSPPGAPWSSEPTDDYIDKNFVGQAASWRPSTVQTTSVGSQTIPSSHTTQFIFNINDGSQFPPTGEVAVGGSATIDYTAVVPPSTSPPIHGWQLTGCTFGAGTSGTVADGSAVTLQDLGWSFELMVPINSAQGGTSWPSIQGHFGLYFNLFRFSKTAPAGTPFHAGSYAAQYRFPLPDASATGADQHLLIGALDETTTIDPSWYGTAVIPALAGGVNDAVGVCFQNPTNPESNVGVRHPGSSDPGALTATIDGPAGSFDNTLVAQIENTDPGNTADNVTAEFRFANWGIPSASFGDWDPASIHGAATPAPVSLSAAGGASPTAEITSNWARASVPPDYQANGGHHCVWVRLDSTSAVNFVEAGVRVNMDFVQLSEHSATATISSKGHAPPTTGGRHKFLLLTHVRSQAIEIIEGPQVARSEVLPRQFIWVVEAFRRTGKTMRVGKTTAEIIDPAGQFGLTATHAGGPDDVFVHALSGGGLTRAGRAYQIDVPVNGEVAVQATIAAGPPADFPPPKLPPTIQEGSKGDDVVHAQFLLSVEGYGIGPNQIDGNFGPILKQVAEAFQRFNGLPVDGAIGPVTWSALFAYAPIVTPVIAPLLKSGATGTPVEDLQQKLGLARNWFARWDQAAGTHGQFDAKTETLIKALQQWANTTVDGTASYKTWAVSAGPSLWDEAGPHAPSSKLATPPTVQEGSTGEAAQRAQFLLSAEGYGLAPAQVDGSFGAATKVAVERFQKDKHLTVDGVVGPTTWEALIKAAPLPHHPVPPTLQSGSKGEIVRLLQEALNAGTSRFGVALGPIKVDGEYGPATVTRVKEFQTWGSVIVDGITSYRTWSVAVGPSLWSL